MVIVGKVVLVTLVMIVATWMGGGGAMSKAAPAPSCYPLSAAYNDDECEAICLKAKIEARKGCKDVWVHCLQQGVGLAECRDLITTGDPWL